MLCGDDKVVSHVFSLDIVILADLIVEIDEGRRLHIEELLYGWNILESFVDFDEPIIVLFCEFVRLIDEMLVEWFVALFDAKDDSGPRRNLRDDVFEEVCLAAARSTADDKVGRQVYLDLGFVDVVQRRRLVLFGKKFVVVPHFELWLLKADFLLFLGSFGFIFVRHDIMFARTMLVHVMRKKLRQHLKECTARLLFDYNEIGTLNE